MEYWNTGILEYWEKLKTRDVSQPFFSNIPYSNVPLALIEEWMLECLKHFSLLCFQNPIFHHSNIPIFLLV